MHWFGFTRSLTSPMPVSGAKVCFIIISIPLCCALPLLNHHQGHLYTTAATTSTAMFPSPSLPTTARTWWSCCHVGTHPRTTPTSQHHHSGKETPAPTTTPATPGSRAGQRDGKHHLRLPYVVILFITIVLINYMASIARRHVSTSPMAHRGPSGYLVCFFFYLCLLFNFYYAHC